MTIRIAIGLAGLLGLVTASAAWSEPIPEEIFEEASAYTVRIKTRIEHAFGDDKPGAFTGTGFIVDADRGWIVTNRHVVGESPSEVQIAGRGAPYRPASKLYVDPFVDIAILQADIEEGQSAKLDCNNDVPGTGHPVGAYGHPWGLEYTGTQGVISGRTDKWKQVMLQTDAPINSGNSGGPLISMRTGNIVGVNTSRYNDRKAENTNFAVPVEDVCRILDLLAQGKDPSPPQLPVAFFNLEEPDAVVIARTFDEENPVGLEPYDRIIAAGPALTAISNEHELINALRGHLEAAQLKVIRNGEELAITADIPAMRIRRGIEFAGIVMAPFNYADQFITPAGHDIGVFTVAPGSRANGSDLKWFDLVYKVNGVRVTGLEQLFVLLNDLDDGEYATLEFLRVLEDMHYFGYIKREIRAEPAMWLTSSGASSGTGVQLSWIASQVDGDSALESRRYLMLKVALDRVIGQLESGELGLDNDERRRQKSLAVALSERLDAGLQAAARADILPD